MMTAAATPDSDVRTLTWMGALFLCIGVGLLLGSAWLFYRAALFDESAQTAPGTVVNLIKNEESRRSRDGFSHRSIAYTPVVAFIDSNGHRQEIQSNISSNPPAYKRGEKVAVLYDPDNPEFAMIDDWHRHLSGFITGGMGLIFSVVGAIFVLTLKKSATQ